ncbi:MAG: hypothetical protein AAF944_26750 [Bacteroidota bacterium]
MILINSFFNSCKPFVLTLGMVALVVACGDSKKTDENLQQAFELHQEAVEIRQMTDKQMDELKANKDSLFVSTYQADLDSISYSLEEWDEQLVEVPGFEHEHDHDHAEHDHDHDHDHDHSHGGETNLTPEQHLQVQQHLLDEIKAIAEEVNQIEG